jgi:hypothetical protein
MQVCLRSEQESNQKGEVEKERGRVSYTDWTKFEGQIKLMSAGHTTRKSVVAPSEKAHMQDGSSC